MSVRAEYFREYRKANRDKMNENLKKHRLKKKSEPKPIEYTRHGKAWKFSEIEYLKEWYGKISAIELSYDLERTPESIRTQYRKIMKEVA